jgi:hypothetical protein
MPIADLFNCQPDRTIDNLTISIVRQLGDRPMTMEQITSPSVITRHEPSVFINTKAPKNNHLV